MKIICFLFDPNVGGPTIRAAAVYQRMIAEGYDVRIAVPEGEGSAAAYVTDRGIALDRLLIAKPVLPRKVKAFAKFAFTAPVSLWRVRAYLRRERPDVIHVNGAFDMIPAFAGRLAGVPVVWHLNDTVFGAGLSRMLGGVVKRVAKVVVVAATRVGQHYDVMDANPHVIFAPVDIARFVGQDPDRARQDPPVLTLIGNWNWIKGQDRFVTVIENLRNNGTDVQGRIVGKFIAGQETFWQPIMDRIARENLTDHIETPGFADDMAEVLRHSDIFLLTSHSEASPISLLEAMAMGVPSVCFDVGGVREMIGDGDAAAGIVVDEGDTAAMEAATKRLLDDPALYRRMSAAGPARVRANFALETCVERHKMAYAEATGTTIKVPS